MGLDLADLALKGIVGVVGIVGGGLGGWFLSAAKHGAQLKEQGKAITDLQEHVAALVSKESLEHAKSLIQADIGRLARDYQALESSLETVSDSSHDLASAAALAAYITENNARWEKMIRLMGKIEGAMEAERRLQRSRDED